MNGKYQQHLLFVRPYKSQVAALFPPPPHREGKNKVVFKWNGRFEGKGGGVITKNLVTEKICLSKKIMRAIQYFLVMF